MEEVFSDPDKEKAQRAMQAMLQMKKLDIGALRAAAEGEAAELISAFSTGYRADQCREQG